MKKVFLQITVLVVLAVASALTTQAQPAQKYLADIPFDFNIGGKNFTAGEYIIGSANPSVVLGGIIIKKARKGSANVFLVIPLSNNEKLNVSKLVFNRYEDQYFLAELNTPTLAAKFFKAKREIKLGKNQKQMRQFVALK